MSYHIVKAISIKEEEGKVYITGSDNNISPRTPYRHEYPTLSAMLVREGREAVEMQIFRDYENGNLQGGKNKWTRALAILRHLPEYKNFDWREDASQERRNTAEFETLLKKALSLKLPAEQYIITTIDYAGAIYLKKLNTKSSSWTREKREAKIFFWADNAERVKTYFTGSDAWTVEKILDNGGSGLI